MSRFRTANALSLASYISRFAFLVHGARLSPEDWNVFNKTVQGRLLVGTPLAKPCYSEYNGTANIKDTTQCTTIETSWDNGGYQSSQPGGYEWTNWGSCMATSQACAIDFLNPYAPLSPGANCAQGSVPDYFVEVQNVSDVQATVQFAKQFGVPLVVKNSGHDHKGRSSAPGSLALWMHPYQPPMEMHRGFVPDGCASAVGDGITFGTGYAFYQLADFADANGVTVVVGSSKTVKPGGGWSAGGGHSPLSPMYGLGVDNILQIKSVLPNGTYITANRCQNQDLFWALRGGGGNAFGVIMEMTFRAWPRVPVQAVYFGGYAKDAPSFRKVVDVIAQNSNTWASQGWGGTMGTGRGGQFAVSVNLVTSLLNSSAAAASMKPLTDLLGANLLVPAYSQGYVYEEPSFYTTFHNGIETSDSLLGVGVALSSRLIPNSYLATADGQSALTDAIVNITASLTNIASGPQENIISQAEAFPLEMLMTAPTAYTSSTDPNDQTSVTPAWRTATWHMVIKYAFSGQANAATVQHAYETVHGGADILRNMIPNTGAYQNEADIFEVNGAQTFWGLDNYQKLQAIKSDIDPDNLFTCWGCIGFDPTDDRYACYPDYGFKDAVGAGYPK